jgi:hypothetical protein
MTENQYYYVLLKKYMTHIIQCESVTYIEPVYINGLKLDFTEHDLMILKKIRNEIHNEAKH